VSSVEEGRAPNRVVTLVDLATFEQADLGWSEWLHLDQARIDVFAEATEDRQWIHVDPDRAAAGPFGATVAHGYLTLSLAPRLMADLLMISDEVRGTNYGVDRARFTSPVRVGSRVRMHGRIVAVRPRTDGGLQYSVRVAVHLEGDERPALVADVIYLSYPA
jgi:acyl dehydratase